MFFFFFQAEDGIRDATVTGVQTCALPISRVRRPDTEALPGLGRDVVGIAQALEGVADVGVARRCFHLGQHLLDVLFDLLDDLATPPSGEVPHRPLKAPKILVDCWVPRHDHWCPPSMKWFTASRNRRHSSTNSVRALSPLGVSR